MPKFYSASTGCTYLPSVHGKAMPADVVKISEALYLAVIGNPASGKIRAHDEHGLPYLVDAPELVPDLATQERTWRDSELSVLMWLRERHRDQLDIGGLTTLTTEQFNELLVYMQALRDWPQSPDFPDALYRPSELEWIVGYID